MQSEQFVQTLNQKMSRCDTSTEAKSLKDELSIYLSVTKDEQLDRVSKVLCMIKSLLLVLFNRSKRSVGFCTVMF